MGKYAEAEEDISTAIELDPKPWQSYYLRAKCRDKLSMYDEALHDYTMVSFYIYLILM